MAKFSISRVLSRSIVTLLPLALFARPTVAQAVNGVWNVDAGGGYGQTGSWVGGVVALGADAIADFTQVNITADRTVSLNANRTIGSLLTGDATTASHDWTFAPNGAFRLTLLTNTGLPTITVVNRTTTISAPIAGTQGFSKLGTGTLVLTNAGNTFTGGITLNAGTLSFSSGALGTNLITTTGSANLTWNAHLDDISSQVLVGDGTTLTLTVSNTPGEITTFATPLQTGPLGTGAVTKANASTVIITAANTYSGGTRVNNGRLVLAGGDDRLSALGAVSFGNTGNSGVLQLGDASGASHQTVTGLATFGTGTANAIVGGHATNSVLTVNNANPVTFNGFLGGTGVNENNLTLRKGGVGTLTLGGNNSFTGAVEVTGGRLAITHSNALGIGTKTVTITGTTDTPGLDLNGETGPISLATSISIVTSNEDVVSPAILNVAGNNVITGGISPTTGGAGAGNTRISVQGGSLRLTGNVSPAIDTAGTLGLILDGAGDGVAAGVIADHGDRLLGVSKDGAGSWILAAANTYSGPTLINAGRLNLTTAQTGGGALTVADGAVLGLSFAAPNQTLHASTLTLGSATGAALRLDLGAAGNPSQPILTASSFATSGSNVLNIAATGLSVGQIPLIAYNGSIGGGGYGGLALGSLPARVTASLVDDAANLRVSLQVTAFDIPQWIGGVDGNWDIDPDGTGAQGTANWREVTSGNATRYLQGTGGTDSVIFDDTPSVASNVILTTTLTPASVTVNTSLNTFVFSGEGKLSGTTALLKDGTATLTLLNTGGNDYSGTTTVLGGTLQIGDGASPGAGQLGTGPVIDHANLVFNRPDDILATNALSGTGVIIKQGAGTLTLSGSNTSYDGAIVVSVGTLKLGAGNALGSTIGGTQVAGSAALEVTGFLTPEPVQLNGGTIKSLSGTTGSLSGNLTLNGGGILDSAAGILSISGAIGGAGNLQKNGAGNVLLSGVNTFDGALVVNSGIGILTEANAYTGSTLVFSGTLQIGATGGAGQKGAPGPGNIVLGGGSGPATLTILRGDHALNLAQAITSTGAGTNAVTIGVTGTASPSGTVTLSGANSFTGNVTINGGALRITNSSALGVGPKTVSIASNAGPSLQLDGTNSDLTLAAGINFTASSDGTIANLAANEGAIVNLAGNNVIRGNIALVNGSGGNGRVQVNGGTLTLAGTIDSTGATGTRTLLLGGPAAGTVAGVIGDGPFAVSVTKDGPGTWTLSGPNTFTGGVTVNAGVLKITTADVIGNVQALGTGTGALTLGTATTQGTLEYVGATAATVGRPITVNGIGGGVVKNSSGALLTLAGNITKNGRPLTLTGGGFDLTGVISGANANSDLIVNGAEVQLSNAGNTYNGPTLIHGGGVLKLGVANGIPTTSAVTLGEAVNDTAGTLDLHGFDQTVGKLIAAGTGDNGVTNSGASGVNILTVEGASTFAGAIHDGPSALTALTKSGSGFFVLSGVSDYSGATTVSGGTLLVEGSLSGTLEVLTDNGGILGGSGSITTEAGGFVVVTAGGALAPGAALDAGTLTLSLGSGQLDLSGSAGGFGYLQFDLGVLSDRVVLTSGALNMGNGLDLDDFSFSDLGGLQPGIYTLFETPSAILGSFGPNLAGNFGAYDVSLALDGGSSGNENLMLVVVPEPRGALLLVAGLTLLGLHRRRRA